MLNRFENTKWRLWKRSQGVSMVPKRDAIESSPNPDPIKINLYRMFPPMKNLGNANMNGMNETAKISAVMVKRIKE